MTVDRNILPGMKPTRHSFRCGQPLGPGVAHHGMRNLVHHAQAHVASPRGERLPAQVADHLSDAAYVVVTVASVPGRSALDHVKLVDIFLRTQSSSSWFTNSIATRGHHCCLSFSTF